jgi:hypothetical protein
MSGDDDTTQLPFLINLGEQFRERAARDEEEMGRGRRFWRRPRGGERRELRRPALAFGGTIGVAAAAAVAIALSVDFGDDGDSGNRVVAPTPATAHAVLVDLARRARAQPNAMPAAGQLFYVRSLSTRLQGGKPPSVQTTEVVTFDRRVWSSPTQAGRLYETAITSRPLAGGRTTRMGNPDAPEATEATGGYTIGRIRLTRAQLLRFPTAPATIVARMRAAQPGAGTADLFDGIGDALREAPAPPALRAGLYRALASLPGVELLGRTHDSRGRAAVAVGLDDAGGATRSDLLLDPRTAEMLAERETLIDPAASRQYSFLPKGTIVTSTVYLRRAAVDSVSDQ